MTQGPRAAFEAPRSRTPRPPHRTVSFRLFRYLRTYRESRTAEDFFQETWLRVLERGTSTRQMEIEAGFSQSLEISCSIGIAARNRKA